MLLKTFLFSVLLPILVRSQEACLPTAQMIDASGKFPAGIFSGNLIDLGSFDTCLSIERAKYCLTKFTLPLSILGGKSFKLSIPEERNAQERIAIMAGGAQGLILGWCIPDNCTVSDVTNHLSSFLNKYNISVDSFMECQTQDDLEANLSAGEWVVVGFLVFILVLMVLSTIYDIYLHYQKEEPAHLLLVAFSVKRNGQKLLAVSRNPDQLPCVHGIRFISMMWVIFGHRYLSTVSGEPIVNVKDVLPWMDKVENMYMITATVSVDSFFVLSGLLVSYIFLLAKDKGVKFNIVMYYIHRYLRLTPVLAVVVLLQVTLVKYFGSGPLWPMLTKDLEDFCDKHWWSTLLYIQNYNNPVETCLGQTWYLSIDFQLFILSPLLLIPLSRWPKITMIVSACLVVVSMVICFVISWHFELGAFILNPNSEKYMTEYYAATHTRYGPWLMGLMLGHYIYTLKKNKTQEQSGLHPAVVVFGWIFALGIMTTVLFSGHDLLTEPDPVPSAFFNALHRHGWSLGLCWVIFACTQGYGGFVDTFLSWSAFQVLSRFSYTIYLVHMIIQGTVGASSRVTTYFSDSTVFYKFWSDLCLSLIVAVCMTLSFESPMLTIEKVIFKTGAKKDKPVLPITNENGNGPSKSGEINGGFVKH